MNKVKIKKQHTFYAFLGKIADILVYPVILLAFVSSFFMLVAKSNNLIPPVFGNCFVRILSGSMKASGFNENDVVIVKKLEKSNSLRIGDIIAFYYYGDTADNLPKNSIYAKHKGEDAGWHFTLDENGNPIFRQEVYDAVMNAHVGEDVLEILKNQGAAQWSEYSSFNKLEQQDNRLTLNQVAKLGISVYFHQIIDIAIDASGMLFYQTKGSSNKGPDDVWTRQDFIVGKYAESPKWIRTSISYCSSTEGMIAIVVIPISILILLELLSVLEQVNNIVLEKKILKRERDFNDKESIKANIGLEMRIYDKAYFYDVMPKPYKPLVYDFLWKHLFESDKPKDIALLDTVVRAISLYNFENPDSYYEVFKNSFKSERKKKKIEKVKQLSKITKYDVVLKEDYQNIEGAFQDVDNVEISNVIQEKELANNIPSQKPIKQKPKKIPTKPELINSNKINKAPTKPTKPPIKKN